MGADRHYPGERAGPFPSPPYSFADREGRTIEVRAVNWAAETEPLVEMYLGFDPADRAQGVPPVGEDDVRDWLDGLADGHNAVAWHDDRAVGHATLVPDGEDAFELAIFVLQSYQGAGIGTELVRTLLGLGADRGVERVWLSVERWNRAAVSLYESVGFETTDAESFELEMAVRLDPGQSKS